MNPNDITAQQAADWCAQQDGWNYEPAKVDGLGATAHYWWRYTIDSAHGGRTYASVHPHPLTLDGADAAIPEGWFWTRDQAATSHRPDGLLLKWTACQRGADNWRVVETPDTGDKTGDLYRLAVACRMAAKEQA